MPATSIVFVDSRVSNYQSLIESLTDPYEVFILEGDKDGLDQMVAYLQGRVGLDAIHVISHGSQGALYLGNMMLNAGNLGSYGAQLASLGKALTDSGDILLYGCDVAQGDVGVQFVTSLADLTGADVAASVDSTRASALGGDWVLEAAVGQVDAATLNVTANVGLLGVNTAPSFVVDYGKVTTDFGHIDQAYGVALQTDGKIVVVGTGLNGWTLARYNSNGILDSTFDGDGKLSPGIVGSAQDALQLPDGKILVAGTGYNNVNVFDFELVRFNSNGSVDTSFGGSGKTLTEFGSQDHGQSVALQSDGKILVAGYSGDFHTTDFAVARYNADGSLDTSFDGDGKLTTNFGFREEAHSVKIQSDGKILVAGFSYDTQTFTGENFAIARYNSDGSLDTSFDGDGKVTTDIFGNYDEAQSMILQTDGKILVAGKAGSQFGLVRYNIDGSLDTSFGGTGKVFTSFGFYADWGQSVSLQADGKILVAGMSASPDAYSCDFALTRYNADGSLDTTFDSDGKLTTNFETGRNKQFGDWVYSVTVQTDGKIVAVGRAGTVNGQHDFALARYNPDGSLDTSFGGISSLNHTASYTENATPIVLDSSINLIDAELALANDFSGASVALQRQGAANPQDTFSSAVGSGVSALTQGSVLTVDGISVGQVTANSDGHLDLLFTTGATQTLVDKALSNIAYSNSSDAPSTSIALEWTLNDGNTGAQGTGAALTSMATTTVTITQVNDAPTGSVTITGTSAQGQTLTASNNLVDPDGPATLNLSYQWTANGSPIAGAINSSFVLGQAEVGKVITVAASYTDAYNTVESKSSVGTTAVVNVNDLPTGSVTITGTATQGQTLTAANTLVDIDGIPAAGTTGEISYQWKASGVDIAGATVSTLVLGQAQVSKAITVVAQYTDAQGTTETATSSATANVANVNDLPTGTVTISGTATQGQTLTAANTLADVDGLGAISYQWSAGGNAISGATNSTYVLGQAEVGKIITVAASYTDAFSQAESKSSVGTTAVVNVNDLPTGSVTISGTATQGQTLAAGNTLIDIDGIPTIGAGAISYQWKASGVDIAGATGGTLVLGQAQVSKLVTVVAQYTDAQGTTESVASSATGNVANVNDAPTGTVTITGTATHGQTLTASNSLADIDGVPTTGAGAISYQWSAGGNAISGATNSTYVLGQAEVGKVITVAASYTDAYNTVESKGSLGTTAVVNVNDLPTGTVTITGTATQGQTLTAGNTLADIDGIPVAGSTGAISYQWKAGGVDIAGATVSTLVLGQAQVSKAITVVAQYTDAQGTIESVASSAPPKVRP